jgi:ComF family protein
MKIFKFILDLIAPKKCYSCKKEWYFLCRDCLKKERDFTSICYVCKATTKNFEICENCKDKVFFYKIIVLTNYTKIISKLIKDAKFYNKKGIFEDFAYYLYEKFLKNHKIKFNDDYVIVSISSHFLKKLKGWYSSSEILCKYFSSISKIRYENNVIKKVRNTKQQSKLSKEERLVNLKDAFEINKHKINKIKDKNIIILDDVISTWTTLNEASKVLKENWAKKIIWLIVASG